MPKASTACSQRPRRWQGISHFPLSWGQGDLFPCGVWGSAPQTLGKNKSRGGRIAEMGAAIVLSLPIYVLGRERNPNVFHSLCIAVQSVTEMVPRLKSARDFIGASR